MALPPAHPSPEALFRYTVVTGVMARQLGGLTRSAAVRAAAEQAYVFATALREVSERSIWRWLQAYERDGLAGLERAERPAPGCQVLDEALIDFLVGQKRADRDASVPELIARARTEGKAHPEAVIDRTTVWRLLRARGEATHPRRAPQGPDTRRFAFRERMQLVMVDYKRFRAGPKRARRGAAYLLDDATRYGLDVRVTRDGERAEDVLQVLARTLRQYGLMSVLYWDHGSGFRADDVLAVLAKLEVAPIFSTAGYPEARGKIERFNRSVQARLLRALSRPDVNPDLAALELRLRHDLFEVYNHLPHESLAGRTPHAVFHAGRPLRPIESEDWLVERFTLPETRCVSADHVVQYGGALWEAPRGLARQEILVHRRLLEGPEALYVAHQGAMIRLHRLDPHFNATDGRARPERAPEAPTEPVPTASMRRFDHDHASMLGPDGGYRAPTPDSEESEP